MKRKKIFFLILVTIILTSCISTKDVKYFQPNENLVVNEEGLIPYNTSVYRVTKNDILNLNIITTPKGDAAQFYSSYNTSGGGQGGAATQGGMTGGNGNYYFTGLKVDSKGDIHVFGIGFIKAEGKTIEELSAEIQERVNENFVEGKSEVRLNTDGIRYYILGDIETTGLTGEKVAYKQNLTLTEALAMNGGLNRTVDRKNIVILRKFPEGIKRVKIDLTREDLMNSPYFYVQNGDEIFLNTRPRSFHGFGKDPLQTLTTGVSLLTTAMSIYLLLSRF
ncbi:MAG: polysaccharide biosynthesis/export family protein [Cloacibacterium sp.]|nr:polysaccharide biosynthesis/export family protein [Cloacibacterium sp.]